MKLKLFWVSILLMTISISATDFKTYLQKGDEFYKKFELAQAINFYAEAYKFANGNYDVLIKMTRTYNDLGEDYYEIRDRKNSEAAINKALEYAEILKN
ncbi:MAG TPA: hypothetical protein VK870_09500, partial [Ignavibacteriaceae bacterium]|nr:hypothetical protein [Ignavibacteriaceae bacterium]